MSLPWSILLFVGVVGLADLTGYGHGYAGLCVLAALSLALARWLSPRGWNALFGTMLGLSILVSILAVVQVWFMPRSRGIFASPNILGAYAVIHLFLAQRRDDRFAIVATVANLAALGLSQSRGAYLAFCVGLLVLEWKGHRRVALAVCGGVLATIAIVTLFHPVDIGPGARFRFWEYGIGVSLNRPWLGWGQNGVWMSGAGDLYSVPLDWLLWTGFVGVAAGGWMLWAAARAADQVLRAVLAAWAVSGLFMFDSAATAIPLWLSLGYIASVGRDVAHRAGRIEDGQPLLNRGVRSDGAKRGHRGRDRAICRE